MNRKILLWLIIAFVAGGFLAARQSVIEQQQQKQPAPATPQKVSEYSVQLFLIAPQDKNTSGEIGCGDSTVAITQKANGTSKATAAMEALLAIKDETYGESGLYNALYQSDLTFTSFEQSGDTAKVKLTGTLKLGGACDNPRVRAQLEQTLKNAAAVDKVQIIINGTALEQLLSER